MRGGQGSEQAGADDGVVGVGEGVQPGERLLGQRHPGRQVVAEQVSRGDQVRHDARRRHVVAQSAVQRDRGREGCRGFLVLVDGREFDSESCVQLGPHAVVLRRGAQRTGIELGRLAMRRGAGCVTRGRQRVRVRPIGQPRKLVVLGDARVSHVGEDGCIRHRRVQGAPARRRDARIDGVAEERMTEVEHVAAGKIDEQVMVAQFTHCVVEHLGRLG